VTLADRIVVRVGGSLLGDTGPLLPDRLIDRLTQLTRRHQVVVVAGGGRRVDQIRREHAQGRLTDTQAHWQSVAQMDANARLLGQHLSHAQHVDSLAEILASQASLWTLGVSTDLRLDPSFPVGWEVTSDSIAGWVALRLSASRLILAKSVGQDGPFDVRKAQELGWVDDYFPRMAQSLAEAGILLEWLNARLGPADPLALGRADRAE
jgi:aspartokinase-like uncharacterized kinase